MINLAFQLIPSLISYYQELKANTLAEGEDVIGRVIERYKAQNELYAPTVDFIDTSLLSAATEVINNLQLAIDFCGAQDDFTQLTNVLLFRQSISTQPVEAE